MRRSCSRWIVALHLALAGCGAAARAPAEERVETTAVTDPAGGTDARERAPNEDAPRAHVAEGELPRCEPPTSLGAAAPVAVRATEHMLGGCGVREAHEAPGPPGYGGSSAPTLEALADLAAVRAAVDCPPEREPDVDEDASYFVLRDVHRSSDRWEVVFAVDDGERVHAGLRLARTCQGVVPTEHEIPTVLEVGATGRALTVHRCPFIPPSCGPVP